MCMNAIEKQVKDTKPVIRQHAREGIESKEAL